MVDERITIALPLLDRLVSVTLVLSSWFGGMPAEQDRQSLAFELIAADGARIAKKEIEDCAGDRALATAGAVAWRQRRSGRGAE